MDKSISFKHFTFLTLSLIVIFIAYHMFIWKTYSSNIFGRTDNMYIGDLGRMSYQVDSLYPRKLQYTLKKRILNTHAYNNEPIDILTIGDSFSNGVMGGKNPYYQDYIATKYNLNILNIMNITNGKHKLFSTIISLYNNGWLEKHKPKLIIIESAQRGVYERFSKNFDFNQSQISIKNLIIPTKQKDSYIPRLEFINTANYKIPFYLIKYKFNRRAQKDVVKLDLSEKLFSTKNYSSTLLFHYSDVLNIKNNQSLINKMNDNFNQLAAVLSTLNIKLLFLVAPDKYDVYSSYIIDNPYQKNDFFKLINPLEKQYYFIDTKAILVHELKKGVKDLYYSDDTHWSYHASEAISDSPIFQKLWSRK